MGERRSGAKRADGKAPDAAPADSKRADAKQREARADAEAAVGGAELDTIATELYGLRPDAFADARDERVRTARADGHASLARELGKLRKPTQSAWLINVLWRDQRDVMEQLFLLADELSRAQAEASGPDLHRLTAQRRELEAALVRRARTLAENAGVTVSAAMEREAQETLSAALARPDVAQDVRSGRLVKPASYAGFGTGFGTPVTVAAPAPPKTGERPASPSEMPTPPRANELAERAALRARVRREEAERRVAETRAALDAAAGTLGDRGREAEAAARDQQVAEQRRAEVGQQVEQLRQQLDELLQQQRELDARVVTARQAASTAQRQRDQADRTHAATLQALQRAEQDLKDLGQAD